jgi:hypothetical protein
MDNKELEPVETSDLPLSTRDSQPPLVVDLPDGQKLVVGDLDPGKVIEIATWRGTGRPDSRTNRLMLGVSANEDEAMANKRSAKKYSEIGTSTTSSELSTEGVDNQNTVASDNTPGKQIVTGVIYSNVSPEGRRNQLPKNASLKNGTLSSKTHVKWIGAFTAISVMAFILLVPAGLKFIHPASGAGTALGTANSSIFVVKEDKNLTVGKSVIADLPGDGLSPVVAIIAAVSDQALLLSIDSGYVQITKEKIHGTVVAVLPFIGQIAKLISR